MARPLEDEGPAASRPPVRAETAQPQPSLEIEAAGEARGATAARPTVSPARTAFQPPPLRIPWSLIGVTAAVGLLLIVVVAIKLGGSDKPTHGEKLARSDRQRKQADSDEPLIILGEETPDRPKGTTAAKESGAKPDAPKTETDNELKPVAPATEPAEKPEPIPVQPVPEEPVAEEPIPVQPVPEEPAAEEPLPVEPMPAEKPPLPATPPDGDDQTKVDVITILPSPKPPAEKPAPAGPGQKPSASDGGKPRPERPRPAKPKPGEEAPAVVAGPPDPNCPACRGSGKVPLAAYKPYVHVEGSPAPKPEQAVFWRFCPKCQQGHDPQSIVDAEAARLAKAGQKHLRWEQKTNWQLVRVENHLVTIHAQLPPAEAQKVGAAIEMMAKHLQELTGSVELTRTRPDDYEMLIVWEKANYAQFLKLMEPEWMPQAGNNWGILQQVAGSTIGEISFFRQLQAGGPPPAHMAVNMAGKQQLMRATGGRAPVWLREGFAAYCENVVLGKNVVHAVDYQLGDLKLTPDWKLAMRQLAALNKLRPWQDMFRLELRDYDAPEHITSFSMVAFLLQTEPKKFLDFVAAVGQGKPAEAALVEAYGRPVEKLQAGWVAGLAGRRPR